MSDKVMVVLAVIILAGCTDITGEQLHEIQKVCEVNGGVDYIVPDSGRHSIYCNNGARFVRS